MTLAIGSVRFSRSDEFGPRGDDVDLPEQLHAPNLLFPPAHSGETGVSVIDAFRRLVLGCTRPFFVLLFGIAVSAAAHATDLVVAVRDGSGNLKLISFDNRGIRLNAEGASAGSVSLISAVRLGRTDRMATAVRDGGGNLLVISWKVGFNGEVSRLPIDNLAQNRAGKVSRISVTSNPQGDRVVTAVRDGSGRLRVIPWLVSASGSVNRLSGDATGTAISGSSARTVSVTFVGTSSTTIATAARSGSGKLVVQTWRMSPGGDITLLQSAVGGAVSEVSVASRGEDGIITAVRDGAGRLLLINWAIGPSGELVRLAEARAGAARLISIFPLASARMVTALQDGGGDLKVIAWEARKATGEIVRLGDAKAGSVSEISAGQCGDAAPVGIEEFQSSVRDGSGRLKAVKWRIALNGGDITRFVGGEASAGQISAVATACFGLR